MLRSSPPQGLKAKYQFNFLKSLVLVYPLEGVKVRLESMLTIGPLQGLALNYIQISERVVKKSYDHRVCLGDKNIIVEITRRL